MIYKQGNLNLGTIIFILIIIAVAILLIKNIYSEIQEDEIFTRIDLKMNLIDYDINKLDKIMDGLSSNSTDNKYFNELNTIRRELTSQYNQLNEERRKIVNDNFQEVDLEKVTYLIEQKIEIHTTQNINYSSNSNYEPKFQNNKIYDLEMIKIEVLKIINELRLKQGLSNLILDEQYSNVAKKHSEDEINREFYDHINPDGKRVADRVADVNLYDYCVSENLAVTYIDDFQDENKYRKIAERIVGVGYTDKGWLNSLYGHGENMLDPQWKTIGLGFALDENYELYTTAIFTLDLKLFDRHDKLKIEINELKKLIEETSKSNEDKYNSLVDEVNILIDEYNSLECK